MRTRPGSAATAAASGSCSENRSRALVVKACLPTSRSKAAGGFRSEPAFTASQSSRVRATCVRHVEPDGSQALERRGKYLLGGLRIDDDVEFRHRFRFPGLPKEPSGSVLPGTLKAPPMITTAFSSSGRRGSTLSAIATLVSGPTATRVISPGRSFARRMMAAGPRSAAERPFRIGNLGARRARLRGGHRRRRHGAGSAAGWRRDERARPPHPASRAPPGYWPSLARCSTLPATVVTARRSISGDSTAYASASASSVPVSTSMMTGIGAHRRGSAAVARFASAAVHAATGGVSVTGDSVTTSRK